MEIARKTSNTQNSRFLCRNLKKLFFSRHSILIFLIISPVLLEILNFGCMRNVRCVQLEQKQLAKAESNQLNFIFSDDFHLDITAVGSIHSIGKDQLREGIEQNCKYCTNSGNKYQEIKYVVIHGSIENAGGDTANGINKIEDEAFSDFIGLKSVYLMDSVKDIGAKAFTGCTSLIKFKFSTTLAKIPDYVFANCTSLPEIKIPGTVKAIGEGSFSNCKSLNSITLHNGIIEINSRAFENCSSLQNVYACHEIALIEPVDVFINTPAKVYVTASYPNVSFCGVNVEIVDDGPEECIISIDPEEKTNNRETLIMSLAICGTVIVIVIVIIVVALVLRKKCVTDQSFDEEITELILPN